MAHYGQPAHPYPGQHEEPPRRTGNGMAVAALVLGIAACVFFWTVLGGVVLGLVGLVLGIVAARRARGGRAPHRGMAVAGAVLSALAVIASAVVVAVGVSFFTSDSFKDYNDCVQHADGKSDRDQCAKDFERDIDGN
jgi:heme/copper-type cytochrome/quinol oxidase subunit 2